MNFRTFTVRILFTILAALILPTLASAQKQSYVWANEPASASYTPNATYSFNSSGGAINISRSGAGTYAVRFAGLGGGASAGGNVLVTSYGGGSENCKVANWLSGGADFTANVRCFTAAGVAIDTMYTVRVTWYNSPSPGRRISYAWADNPASASYTPSTMYSFNSIGGAINISRSGVGTYAVRFSDFGSGQGAIGGNVLVTAYGGGTETCKAASWDNSGADYIVNVRCFTAAGAAVDTMYTVQAAWGHSSSFNPLSGYAWADSSASASYTPSTMFSFNSAALPVSATRSGVGAYAVRFSGLGGGSSGGNVQVTAYGSDAATCKVGSWNFAPTDFIPNVRCFKSGVPVDTRYSINVVR
jgi:hypothetical protein